MSIESSDGFALPSFCADYEDNSILWSGDVKYTNSINRKPNNDRYVIISSLWIHLYKKNSPKAPTSTMHHLDIVSLLSTGGCFTIEFSPRLGGKPSTWKLTVDDKVGFAHALRRALKEIHVCAAEMSYLRLMLEPELLQPTDPNMDEEFDPAAGVGAAYRAFCSYNRVCWTPVLADYAVTALSGQQTAVYDLSHCPAMGSGIVSPEMAILALCDDRQFRAINMCSIHCENAASIFGEVLKWSKTITKASFISLPDMQYLSSWAKVFDKSALQMISFAGTRVNSSSFLDLIPSFKLLDRPITMLDFTNSRLSSKVTYELISICKENESISSSLKYLSLSGNKFNSKGWKVLMEWFDLYRENLPLESLGLADTGADLNMIKPFIKTITHLNSIDISGNKFSTRSGDRIDDLLAEMKGFRYFGARELPLTPEQTYFVVSSLERNEYHNQVSLDLAKCSIGDLGAASFARASQSLMTLTELDVSGNKIGSSGIQALLDGMKNLVSLRALWMADNLGNDKGIMNLGVSLILFAEQHPTLTALDISTHSRTPARSLYPFLRGLNRQVFLRSIDISGHGIGDEGALILSGALRKHPTLTQLAFDRNHITSVGWQTMVQALKHNMAMQHIKLPEHDYHQALYGAGQASEAEFSRIVAAIDDMMVMCKDHYNELGTEEVKKMICMPDVPAEEPVFAKPTPIQKLPPSGLLENPTVGAGKPLSSKNKTEGHSADEPEEEEEEEKEEEKPPALPPRGEPVKEDNGDDGDDDDNNDDNNGKQEPEPESQPQPQPEPEPEPQPEPEVDDSNKLEESGAFG